jgi:DNA-directed RNA polymerase specialized sigma24 family protein
MHLPTDGPDSDGPHGDGASAIRLMARVSRGQRRAQLELLEAVGLGMQRTLHRLVGNEAPIEPLLEAALLRVVNRAPEYTGYEPLTLWAQSIAVQVATSYLGGATTPPGLEAANATFAPDATTGAELTPKIRDLLARVHVTLRRMRPEEQVAFALIDLDGRSLGEASSLMRASPAVVRQRAIRARRCLLFAARSDRLIAGYVRLADQLRRIAGRLHRLRLHSLGSDSLRRAQGRVVQILTPDLQR